MFRHADAGYVCAIYPGADDVGVLSEHVVRLDDPDGIREGEGRQTRFLRVRERADNLVAVIGRYVRDAVAERLYRR